MGIFHLKLFSENCWKHCRYKEWVSFHLGWRGINCNVEQKNCPSTASWFTRFVCAASCEWIRVLKKQNVQENARLYRQCVCPALQFIPHEPCKKDTHSLNEDTWSKEHEVGDKAKQHNPGVTRGAVSKGENGDKAQQYMRGVTRGAVIKGENGYKAKQYNIPGAKNMRYATRPSSTTQE